MAAGKDIDENTHNRRGTVCSMVISNDETPSSSRPGRPTIIFNPDFFVEKLRHESPDVFLELVLSNVTRLIDLPGAEFAQLLGEESPKAHSGGNGGFFRSLNFLKRKDKGIVFGTPLTEGSIAQIYQLIVYLSKNLHVEGLFRVPGNSLRQQALRELLNSGADVDLESGLYHPNDVATLLKTFLGELPEPVLTHRHFHAHVKIADMTLFNEQGNKTSAPDKERQIEALQLLFLLLPQANRSLLKLLLDLLYHTAKQQDKNKMSAFNLALMFAPHVLWPRHMTATDLKDNLKKLNNGMAFLIKHSQKLFRAPVYLREYARMHFAGTKALQTKDDLELLAASSSPMLRVAGSLKRPAEDFADVEGPSSGYQSPVRNHTEEALKELFVHINHSMPDSAKKKKLIRQLAKQNAKGTPTDDENHQSSPASRKKHHRRTRSFGGLIKRKNRGEQLTAESRSRHVSPNTITMETKNPGKENLLQSATSQLNTPVLRKAGLVVETSVSKRLVKVSNSKESPSNYRMCFSPSQEISM